MVEFAFNYSAFMLKRKIGLVGCAKLHLNPVSDYLQTKL